MSTTATVLGHIDKAPLTITATGHDKVYDGKDTATVTLNDNRFTGDILLVTSTATFNDKNAGNNKPVSVSNISITGADAGNYFWNDIAVTTANITPRNLFAIVDGANTKVYDGNKNATVTTFMNRHLADDDVVYNYVSALFVDANVGGPKIVTVSGIYLTGADANNYSLEDTVFNTSGRITPATANINVMAYTNATVTYDGSAHTATGTATGVVNNEDLSSNLDLTGTTKTDAGTYNNLQWSFHDPNGNYADDSGTVSCSIAQATAIIAFADDNSYVYDGNIHTTTGTASGVEIPAEDLSNLLTICSTSNANAGTYPVAWAFNHQGLVGDNYNPNYTTQISTTPVEITKADANVIVNNASYAYNGNIRTTTGSAAGVLDIDLSSQLTIGYTSSANVDTYHNVAWSFAGGTNYNNESGFATIEITPALANVVVTNYDGIYDGDGHAVGFTVIGIHGTFLGLMVYSASNAGDYSKEWPEITAGNYTIPQTSVHFVIHKTDAIIDITPYTDVTYDGLAHTVDGTAKGVKGESLDGLNLSSTTETNAGTYNNLPWAFTDATGNYNDKSGTVSCSITPATPAINMDWSGWTYDATAHLPTGSVTGVNNAVLGTPMFTYYAGATVNPNSPLDTPPVFAGTYTVVASYSGSNNYTALITDPVTVTVAKADATFTFADDYSFVYDGDTHTTAGTATILSVVREKTNDGSFILVPVEETEPLIIGYTSSANANTYAVAWTFYGNINYNAASGTTPVIITPAPLLVTAHGIDKVYDGTTDATVTFSDNRITGDSLSVVYTSATFDTKNVGTGKTVRVPVSGITLNGADANNYRIVSATAIITTTASITKADAIIDVTPYNNVIYDGQPHTATGTAKGVVDNEDLSGDLNLTGTTETNAGTYSNLQWSFHDPSGNYADDSGTVSCSIAPATVSIAFTNDNSSVYDGHKHTTAGSATGVNGTDLSSLLTICDTSSPNVGTYAVDWTFNDQTLVGANYNPNYTTKSGTTPVVITKATVIPHVTDYYGHYDGQAHTASGYAAGVDNVSPGNLTFTSSYTDAGHYTTGWSFAESTNYKAASGTANIDIDKALGYPGLTFSILPYVGTYDGNYHHATGTVIGFNGIDLSNLLDLGESFVNAGDHPTTWTFAGNNNYEGGVSGYAQVLITKATVTPHVTDYNNTYDEQAHTASGYATGVNGNNDVLGNLTFTSSYTDVGNYTTGWSFAETENYKAASGTTSVVITPATLIITATGIDKVYDGTTNATVTFSDNRIGNDDISVSYASATFDTKNAGNNKPVSVNGISVTGADAGNYTFNTVATATANITKADANIAINHVSYVYNTNFHTTTGTATGVGTPAEDLPSSLLTIGNTSDIHAGTYAVDWTFTGNTNYKPQSGTAEDVITITKADATFTFAGDYSFVYDGDVHTTTGTATTLRAVQEVVNGQIILVPIEETESLTIGYTSSANVDTYAVDWSFAGDGNYNPASGTTPVVITPATLIITATGINKVYDGTTNTTVTLNDNRVAGDVLQVTYASAAFSDKNAGNNKSVNVNGISVTGADAGNYYWNTAAVTTATVTKADATIDVSPYDVTYNGSTHTATGTAKGVNGESLSGLDLSSTTHANAGTYTDTWTFAGGTNYNDSHNTVTDVIRKADALVKIKNDSSYVYDASIHTTSGSATGVNEDLSSQLSIGYTASANVGTYSIAWSFMGGQNYLDESGNTNVIITPAKAVVTVTPFNGTYDSFSHHATGTAMGVNGTNLTSLLNISASFTDTGNYSATWTFHDPNGNYFDASGLTSVNITQANANIVINGWSGIYNGYAHGASGYATGINGVSLSYLLNTGSSYVNAGTYTSPWLFLGDQNYKAASGTTSIIINPMTIGLSITTQQAFCISSGRTLTFTTNLGKVSQQYANLFNNVPITISVNGTGYTTTVIAHLVRSGGRTPTYKVTYSINNTPALQRALLPITARNSGRPANVFTISGKANRGNYAFASQVKTILLAGKNLLAHYRRFGW